MKKSILLGLVALFFATSVTAKPVSVEQARKAATTFLQSVSRTDCGTLSDLSSHLPFTEFYTFAIEGGGFVLVSGDDCVMPILGYSLSKNFGYKDMPEHVQQWLQDYEDQIAFYKAQESSRQSFPVSAVGTTQRYADNPVAQQWHDLLSGKVASQASKSTVGPLLSTQWDQSPYYNNACPYDDYEDDYAVAGCVAIAMAQIMKYYNYPTSGYSSHSYYHDDFGTLSANFGTTTYDWTNMPTSLSYASTTTQVTAVSTLVYHVGVAVEMDYSVASSGALSLSYGDATVPSAENALRDYFKYSPTVHSIHMEDYTAAEWKALLKTELDSSRPILYSGRDTSGGHAFVCDGYNTTTNMFHFNWGWGGYCDGYYAIGSLNPTPGGTGGNSSYTFNLSNAAVIGIEPNDSFSTTGSTTVTASANSSTYGSVTGGGSKTFGTLVSLKATANSGYRFVEWSDGYRYNPREFTVNGGSLSFTAVFEPLAGDTISYCDGNHNLTSFGYGTYSDDVYWGIKIPSTALSSGQSLEKVQLYANSAGTYTLNVYVGSTSSATYTANYTVTSSNEEQWNTFTLSTPVSVTGTQPVWITFKANGLPYPATMTYYGGSDDGLLWGNSYTTIADSWDYSFMIRGIFSSGSSDTTVAVTGDTLTYVADSSFSSSIGAGGAFYWGVSFPPSMLTGHNYLDKVLLYLYAPGTYTLYVCTGDDTEPGTVQYTKSYTFTSGTNNYVECLIDTLLAIDQTEYLWVYFYNSGVDYPAAGCGYVNDARSNWVSLDGSEWYGLLDISDLSYSWLIECITSQTPPAAVLSVDGPTQVMSGNAATYTAAVSQPGYSISWSLQGATPSTATGATATATWSNAGTYNVIATATNGSDVLHDTLVVNVTSCNTITTFPYAMGFESNEPMTCWTFQDNDNDGWGWMTNAEYNSGYEAHNGSVCLISSSYENNTGVLYPDNWAILPAMALPAGATITMTWYDAAQDASYAEDKYSVYVASSISALSTATAVFSQTLSTNAWTMRTVNLSSYAGQTVYIAFRHHDCSDMFWLKIDDISVTASGVESVTINCTGNGSGSVTHSGSSEMLCGTTENIATGQSVIYDFVPAAGSTVDHIYVNNVDKLNVATAYSDGSYGLSLTITGTTVINAVFGSQGTTTYYITAVSADESMGHVTGGGSYEAGATVTLKAIPEDGFVFDKWQDNVTTNPRTFTCTGDATYTAYFKAVEGIATADAATVSLYPNPARESVTVSVSGMSGKVSLTLVDALGRQVAAGSIDCSQTRSTTLDVSQMARGIYFMRLTDANGLSTVRKLTVR